MTLNERPNEAIRPEDVRQHLESFRFLAGADLDGDLDMSSAHLEQTGLKLAPHADWRDATASDHIVQFYESDDILLDSLNGFIGTGLRGGDVGMVIATQPHREGLASRLHASGLDVDAMVASGRYIPLDAGELLSTFMIDGHLEPGLCSGILEGLVTRAAGGGHAVRVFGELVMLLWAGGNSPAALSLESLWNELQAKHGFTLFCAYPMHGFDGETLSESLQGVCAEHSRIIPAESYNGLATPLQRLEAIALLQQKALSLEREVAERKRAQEALTQSLHLRDQFLSAISHDLKTPLTVLHGHAQILQRRAARGTLDTETVLRGVEQIERTSRKMAALIDELLDVTRLRAGEELQLYRKPVDLVALVREAVAERDEITTDLQVVVEAAESELVGSWDARRLGRVVDNLVSNAIKFSSQGTVTVSLKRESSAAGCCAVLTVRDQGMGMAEDDLPHIFEPFYRGGNAPAGIAGTGLGLAGVQRIVEQHGGTIAVESREGLGSTFTVRLPI